MTTVEITELTEPTALFHRYPGESQPQPCYIYLNLESGRLRCDYNGAIGGAIPAPIHDGRTCTWPIQPLTADAANQLMTEVAPLAQRILDGSSIEWDGNRYIGHLDVAAQAASDHIQAIADEWADPTGSNVVSEIDAADWYAQGDDLGLTADTTDEQLNEIEQSAEADIRACAEGTIVVTGLRTYLERRRDEMRSAVREALEEVAGQLDHLTELRGRLVRQIAAWGTDSDRQIGALAGRSHTWVQTTVRSGRESAV